MYLMSIEFGGYLSHFYRFSIVDPCRPVTVDRTTFSLRAVVPPPLSSSGGMTKLGAALILCRSPPLPSSHRSLHIAIGKRRKGHTKTRPDFPFSLRVLGEMMAFAVFAA